MEEEKEEVVSRGLDTMLPLDVHKNLTEYAKLFTKTGLGKWDYGVAIRSLLEKASILSLVNILAERVANLEERLNKLEGKKKKVRTFGGEIDVKSK